MRHVSTAKEKAEQLERWWTPRPRVAAGSRPREAVAVVYSYSLRLNESLYSYYSASHCTQSQKSMQRCYVPSTVAIKPLRVRAMAVG